MEGLREISHSLEDRKQERKGAYQRVTALLCRHGFVWDRRTKSGNPRKMWTKDFWSRVLSIRLDDPLSQKALEQAIEDARSAKQRCDDAERDAKDLVAASSLKNVVYALTCPRCIQLATALAFVAEVGDFARFASGRKIVSYFGLAPREDSSANAHRLGRMTKSGSSMVRKMLIECSWSATRCGGSLEKCPDGTDPRIVERSRALSKKIAQDRKSRLERGMAPCKANGATAAELARFMLFLGVEQQEIDREAQAQAAA